MTLPAFDYVRAGSLKEASELASEKGSKAILMAGGTDVILLMKAKAVPADTVIDIKEISDLDSIVFSEGEGMRIGALAKLFDIQTSYIVREKMPALADADTLRGVCTDKKKGHNGWKHLQCLTFCRHSFDFTRYGCKSKGL